MTEGEFFCFCEGLYQIIGEREFASLEAKAVVSMTPKGERKLPTLGSAAAVQPLDQDTVDAMPDNAPQPSPQWAPLAKEAKQHLKACMANSRSKDGRKVLRKAINDARAAGVDRELLDEAVELVRQIEVEQVLQRAMDSKNPKLLKAAILNVSSMNVETPLLKEAENLLHETETSLKQNEARKGLTEAVATGNANAVKHAIVAAEKADLAVSEVSDARRAERLFRYRSIIEDATQKRDALPLAHLIVELEKENSQDMELKAILAEAEQQIAMIRNEEAEEEKAEQAKKKLLKTMMGGSSRELKVVIREAEEAKVPAEDLEKARKILAREETRQALTAAISTEKRSDISKALEAAIEMRDTEGVTFEEIKFAEEVLAKLDASRDLSMALDSLLGEQTVASLQALVEIARQKGVDDAKIKKAEHVIEKKLKEQKGRTQAGTAGRTQSGAIGRTRR